jgi:hypothetical protein
MNTFVLALNSFAAMLGTVQIINGNANTLTYILLPFNFYFAIEAYRRMNTNE